MRKKSRWSDVLYHNSHDIVTRILYYHTTIRELAKLYGCSKSTLHNYLHSKEFKYFCGSNTFNIIQKILDDNFDNKYLRGGQATKLKYFKERSKNSL